MIGSTSCTPAKLSAGLRIRWLPMKLLSLLPSGSNWSTLRSKNFPRLRIRTSPCLLQTIFMVSSNFIEDRWKANNLAISRNIHCIFYVGYTSLLGHAGPSSPNVMLSTSENRNRIRSMSSCICELKVSFQFDTKQIYLFSGQNHIPKLIKEQGGLRYTKISNHIKKTLQNHMPYGS